MRYKPNVPESTISPVRSVYRMILISMMLLFPLTFMWGKDISVSGVVRDKSTGKSLASVSLIVKGTNIGTVSNADGSFSLTFPDSLIANGIHAEQIGYKGLTLSGHDLGKQPLVFSLQPGERLLDEVTVYGANPRELIEIALDKIADNYPSKPNLFSSFYRETIRKGKRFIGVSEAIVNVYKQSYRNRSVNGDKVQIMKGRRLMSQRSSDTLAVKIVGGPNMPIFLDIVKNEDALFSSSELDYYDFRMEPMTMLDDRRQFVVSFSPKVKTDYALNKGTVYIDQETISFTRAEYSLDVSDKEKATRAVLVRKPHGLRFKPQEVSFVVTYKFHNGLSYLNYISAKTRFKCDWKRRLFSSGYTAEAEMVMVDRDDNPVASIPNKQAFKQKEIFYDMVDDFSDPQFWTDYNIIEPTESLEKAVLKLMD